MSTSSFAVPKTDAPEARQKGHDRKCTQCGERLPQELTRDATKPLLCPDCALDGLPHTD